MSDDSKFEVMPKKSVMMDLLYGQELAATVYDRCQELNPHFNKLVQGYVYDTFWARPGLDIKEKSLVTVISLLTLKKAEQLQIHLKGFCHLDQKPDRMLQILEYMATAGYATAADVAIAAKSISMDFTPPCSPPKALLTKPPLTSLLPRHKKIIDLSVCVAVGDLDKLAKCIHQLLDEKALSKGDIENIMIHQIVYCGFPCAMNGFAVLKKTLETSPVIRHIAR